ncbi:signal peptidase I [Nocardioides sp.]|uniref:signal peptidase I n=1 Tax=Nocardioides sp. TaxID=35761 RepID=UPI0027339669|nr:signal peptidase I [Nocardioides sp.]MDP3893445.1 signal peptidase I [Nocardioides sp.]
MTSEDRDPVPVEHDDDAGSRSSPVRGRGRNGRRDRSKKKHLPWWQETILLLAVALGLAIVVKALFFQAFYIPSESMEPGLVEDDRILVQKVTYWGGGEPQRGDVVVFEDPGGWLNSAEDPGPTTPFTRVLATIGLYPTGGHLVKRVIGVEGDTVVCCDEQGRLSVNDVPLEEAAYIAPQTRCNGPMARNCDWSVGPIPSGRLFVMGDNRGRSADSTVHLCRDDDATCDVDGAFVPVDHVVGKVFLLAWPTDHFRWVTRPESFADVPDAPEVRDGADAP